MRSWIWGRVRVRVRGRVRGNIRGRVRVIVKPKAGGLLRSFCDSGFSISDRPTPLESYVLKKRAGCNTLGVILHFIKESI